MVITKFKPMAVDTGKGDIKAVYEHNGEIIKEKITSTIGYPDPDSDLSDYGSTKPVKVTIPNGKRLKVYECFMDIPGLCNIGTTNANAKNGMGEYANDPNNHDNEIATVGICVMICKMMKRCNVTSANVPLATGLSLGGYFDLGREGQKDKNAHRKYFETILPVGEEVAVEYEGIEYRFTITDFLLRPETLSAFLYLGGKSVPNLVLVDIGGNNVQFVLYKDGQVVNNDALTYTDKGGINYFIKQYLIPAAKKVELIDEIEPSIGNVQSWIADPDKSFYDPADVEKFKKAMAMAKPEYLDFINKDFNDKIGGKYKSYLKAGFPVYYIGGGALLLVNEISKINGFKASTFENCDEYANAMGYYHKLLKHLGK